MECGVLKEVLNSTREGSNFHGLNRSKKPADSVLTQLRTREKTLKAIKPIHLSRALKKKLQPFHLLAFRTQHLTIHNHPSIFLPLLPQLCKGWVGGWVDGWVESDSCRRPSRNRWTESSPTSFISRLEANASHQSSELEDQPSGTSGTRGGECEGQQLQVFVVEVTSWVFVCPAA